MKKFFTSGKFGIKNKKFASILDALLGWSFFVISCCTALFVYFYASENNDVAYAVASDSETKVTLLGCKYSKVHIKDYISGYLFEGGGHEEVPAPYPTYVVNKGANVTITCTLETGWVSDEEKAMVSIGDGPYKSYECKSDKKNGSVRVYITLENVTDYTYVYFCVTPVEYKVKFKSNISDFNNATTGVIQDYVAQIDCTGETDTDKNNNLDVVSNGEINFKYGIKNSFKYTITPGSEYGIIPGSSIQTSVNNNNITINPGTDNSGSFSITFNDAAIQQYKNSDIEILVTGIEKKSTIKIETDSSDYKSEPRIGGVTVQFSDSNETSDFDIEDGFYTKVGPKKNYTATLTIKSEDGYRFSKKNNNNEDVKIEVEYFPESVRNEEINWSKWEPKITEGEGHSQQEFTITLDVEEDMVIRINNIMFDEYDIRITSDNKEYNNSNGFLQLKDESTNKERIEIIQDAKDDALKQDQLENLRIKFDTPIHFKITPKNDYCMSNISVFVGEEEISLCKEWDRTNHFKGYYEFKLDSNNIDKFYDKESGYVNITVKGICINSVNVLVTYKDGCLVNSWNKVSSIGCKGSIDANEQQLPLVLNPFTEFKNVKIGVDRTAKIKIKLDQWYEFKKNVNYNELISASNAAVTYANLEKREKNTNQLKNYDIWYETNELEGVAVFTVRISEDIHSGGDVTLFLNTVPDDMIEGYDNCSIKFTNEEEGLTFAKLDATSEGKFTLSDSSITNKNFSGIKFGEPSYFLVEADGFKYSLGEKVRVNGSFANCEVVDDAIVNNVATNPNQRVVRVTINDQSDNYYPGLPAEVKIGGVIVEDRFAMVKGINTEAIKEADITEFKKFELNLDPPIGESKTKISTGYGHPLSFVIRPASGYSFTSENKEGVLSVYEIKKDKNKINPDSGNDLTKDKNKINPDFGNDLTNDYVGSGKLIFENLGSSLEIRIASMVDNIYIIVNSTPDKVPINFKQSEGMEYFKVDEEKVGEVNEEKIGDQLRGTVTIDKSEDYKFAVKVLDGYDFQSLKVFSNDVGISESGTLEQEGIKYHVYTLPSVEKYTNITASVEKLKCKLTFTKPPVGAYYTKSGSDKEITEQFTEDGILYGSNFSFRVKLKDEYNQSKLTVRAYGNEIQPLSDDTYTIYNITEDGTISIDDNIKLNNYTVNFESSDRAEYILEGSNGKIKNVEYGGNCKFKVRAKTGYKLGENIAVNCVGASGSESLTGKKVSGSGNDTVYEYEIGNITENKTISVSGVEDLFYNIKLQDVEGVTYINDTGSVISGTHKIAYGKNFEFSVNVDDAYDDSIPGMFIIVNEGKSMGVSAQKLSSGKYVIPNITQDITVRVGNIRKNRYTVTFTKTEGIDYYDTNGKIITGDTEVEQNDSISFKVSLYPAYSDSKITVMLGDKAVTADSSGVYTLTGIDENKTVTVLGVEKSKEAELINTINSLPNPVRTLDDVNLVIEASKIYNSLSDEKKKAVTNYDLLQELQEQVKAFHHISNDVKVEGVDWYLKLVAVPISSSTEICSRIYEKLNSEYILSLYDIYLWDTLTDKRYTLPSGTTAVISIPTPDMTYFNKPTGIHENDDGKIDYLSLTFDGGRTTFEAVTFSPFGVIANRSSTPGRSSLLDAVDANVDLIKDFALSSFGGNSSDKSGISESAIFDDKNSNSDLLIGSEDGVEGNISEKYKSRNNKVTARGSALRLILVLMIIVLIALALWILYKRRNEMKKSKNNKNS